MKIIAALLIATCLCNCELYVGSKYFGETGIDERHQTELMRYKRDAFSEEAQKNGKRY